MRRLSISGGAAALVCVCLIFGVAVVKIDSRVNHVSATSCHVTGIAIRRINSAHEAIREQSTISIIIARQAIASLHQALADHRVPPSLIPVYRQSIHRQRLLITREHALRASVLDVAAQPC